MRGDPPEEPVTARPCVGLCYLMRLSGKEIEVTTRKPKKPCIGLCYLAKIGAVPAEAKEPTSEEVIEEEEEELEEVEEEEEEYVESGEYEEEEDYEDK